VQGLLQAGFWALAAASPAEAPAALSLQQALAWPAAALPAPAQAGAPAAEAVLALQQDFISPVPALEPAQAFVAGSIYVLGLSGAEGTEAKGEDEEFFHDD